MRPRRGLFGWARVGLVCALLSAFSADAQAQGVKEQAEAKQLWTTGRQAIAGGRADDAAERFRKAVELHPKAQYKLDLARALVQQKKLVEAVELLNQVATTGEPNSGLAIAAAKKLLKEVEPRLPWVKITVKGPSAGDVVTTIDGERVDASGEIPFDPGQHTVVAEAEGYEPGEKTVDLAEGAHEDVVFVLTASAPEAPDVVAEEEPDDEGGGSLVPPIIAFGVGAVGLGVGTAFGIIAFNQTSEVEERCGGSVCPPEEQDALDESKRNGNISTVGFVVGAVGVSTGIILLLAMGGGDDEPEDEARLVPVVGPGVVGVRGAF